MTGVDLHISYPSDGVFELRPSRDHYRWEIIVGDTQVGYVSMDKRVVEANRDFLLTRLDAWLAIARDAILNPPPEKPQLTVQDGGVMTLERSAALCARSEDVRKEAEHQRSIARELLAR